MHWFWIAPFLFMIFFFVFASRAFRRTGRSGRRGGRGPARPWFACCGPDTDSAAAWSIETPREILDRRFAAGELSHDQYEQMKRDLSAEAQDAGGGEER